MLKTQARRLCHTRAGSPCHKPNRQIILRSYLIIDRVKHGDDIFRGDIGHNIVDLLKDESPAGSQNTDLLLDVFSDRVRRFVG